MGILLRFIPYLLRGLSWLWKTRIGLWLGVGLAWLGINFGTLKIVVEPTIDALTAYAQGTAGSGTGEYWATGLAWMGVLNFDRALTMIISAVLITKGMKAGRLFLFKRGVGA